MATFIQVSQAESELLRRNRDQVAANRLQKVEADEQAATGQAISAALAQQQEILSGRRRELRRRIEPAASRVLVDDFFFLLCNINRVMDDVFTLRLIQEILGVTVDLPGTADFTADNEATTYVWATKALTSEQFIETVGGKAVNDALVEQLSFNGLSFTPVYKPFYLLPAGRLALNVDYTMRMVNVKQNDKGNYGLWYAGRLGSATLNYDPWSPADGDDADLTVKWLP